MRVLVVDDDPVGLDVRRMVLEKCGHQVTIAANVGAARACLGTGLDAVVMDLRLPSTEDGLELLRELHESVPGARVVVFSGYAEDLEGCAERAYATEVLAKPARTERLLEALGA